MIADVLFLIACHTFCLGAEEHDENFLRSLACLPRLHGKLYQNFATKKLTVPMSDSLPSCHAVLCF